MGIPGAGKSRIAEEYVARGYLRLNRDERGGSLRELAEALDEALAGGARRVVLDNTYLTRASRSHVLEAAGRHGVAARCVWLDTPLAQAQVNLVERLLDRFGALPTPEELRAAGRREPGVLTPTSQMRALRELEPPSADEGFGAVEHVPFERASRRGRAGRIRRGRGARGGRAGSAREGEPSAAPRLRLEPGRRARELANAARLAAVVAGPVEARLRAPRRAADLLVPAAAPGPPARVRAGARRRPGALAPRRHRPRAQGRSRRRSARAHVEV